MKGAYLCVVWSKTIKGREIGDVASTNAEYYQRLGACDFYCLCINRLRFCLVSFTDGKPNNVIQDQCMDSLFSFVIQAKHAAQFVVQEPVTSYNLLQNSQNTASGTANIPIKSSHVCYSHKTSYKTYPLLTIPLQKNAMHINFRIGQFRTIQFALQTFLFLFSLNFFKFCKRDRPGSSQNQLFRIDYIGRDDIGRLTPPDAFCLVRLPYCNCLLNVVNFNFFYFF